jgi:diguanylate cyclase (GGDEF)-like protein
MRRRWPIKWRVLVAMLLPPFAIALALTLFFTKVRLDEIEQSLHDRGEGIARQLAPAAEFAAFTRNRDVLEELAQAAQREPDVSLVTITDSAGALLAASGNLSHQREPKAKTRGITLATSEAPELLHISEPIRTSVAKLDDLAEQIGGQPQLRAPAQKKPLGWVNVTMSKNSAWKHQEQIWLISAVIAVLGVLLSALAALRLARGITQPIKKLAGAVEQIVRGGTNVQVAAGTGGEVGALEDGIEAMTQGLKTSREEMQQKIDTAHAQIAYQASHDLLTGLINRAEFEDRLERALSSAKQHGNMHALFFMDLDQFKVVNDTCGHDAGDELLRQIAQQLRQRVRERDTLARVGGDEFTGLLENCHLDDAVQVAQQLRETVQNFRFAWEDKYFAVGASLGIVMITHASESVGTLLSQADAACYTAKDLGRNRIYVFNEDDAARLARVGAMEWVTRITHAFQENRFALYCQSILPLKGAKEGDPEYYEILLRMHGASGEVILPMAFIPAAERFNQMQAIDRWVIRESFATLRRLLDRHGKGRNAIFSINLSGSSLCDEKFSVFLQEQFTQFDIPPHHVCFEVTETTAISNLTHAVKLIQYFKRLGCRFVLDDFGAGLSSFNYLKHLPVDGIKVDGAFVRGMATNRTDATMVEAINNIGHAMGLATTAEFVEDDVTVRMLLELGVDYAQGNWVQRPRFVDEWFGLSAREDKGAERTLRLVSNNEKQG